MGATIPSSAFLTPTLLRPPSSPRYARCPQTHLAPQCTTDPPPPKSRRKRPSRKPSAFENTIEDLTMKRLGRGTIYYGERASTAADLTPDGLDDDEDDADDADFLKPEPVLVAGCTGRTGQWIALGLMNQGFNVRCLTRSFARAEKMFGPSGANLDVFEANLRRKGEVAEAVEGAVAVVAAADGGWWPGAREAVDVGGVRNLVEAAKEGGIVKRFVLISATGRESGREKAKREAEEVVRESGLPYVIMRVRRLNDSEGGRKRVKLEVQGEGKEVGEVSRVDLAQAVCQALVYDRSVAELRENDPEGEFDFPSCVVSVENEQEDYAPDKRFWKREFNRITDAYREKTSVTDNVAS